MIVVHFGCLPTGDAMNHWSQFQVHIYNQLEACERLEGFRLDKQLLMVKKEDWDTKIHWGPQNSYHLGLERLKYCNDWLWGSQ